MASGVYNAWGNVPEEGKFQILFLILMLETATELLLYLSWMTLPTLVLVHVLESEPQPEQEQVQELAPALVAPTPVHSASLAPRSRVSRCPPDAQKQPHRRSPRPTLHTTCGCPKSDPLRSSSLPHVNDTTTAAQQQHNAPYSDLRHPLGE